MLYSVFLLALRSVRRNLLRSFLSILGIVIGVSPVNTEARLGNGATRVIQTQITSLGANLLVVSPGQRGPGGGGVPQFTEADAEAMRTQIGGVVAVAPVGRTSSTVVANGRNWATSVTGSSNETVRGRQLEDRPGLPLRSRRAVQRRGRLHHRRDRAAR
jgi:putative ABC transport system permease protein